MKDQKIKKFVDTSREELSRLLRRHGFAERPLFEKFEKQSRFYWPREQGWKVDAVELWYPRPMVHALFVSLRVYLPGEMKGRTGETELGMLLDGTELDPIVGRSKPYYVEGLLVTPSRLAKRIATDVEQGLHWFDSFPTPRECLRRLDVGKTMWGDRPSRIREELRSRLQESAGNRNV